MNNDLRYPIGRAVLEESLDDAQRQKFIQIIADTPANLRNAVKGLSDAQLDTPYRDGGWSVRQLVHHVADSHMVAYSRFKLTLTEDNPNIRGYDEAMWAKLPDSQSTPIEVSLQLLDNLHQRWVALLKSMKPEEFARAFQHTERGPMNLNKNLALYAWHGPHHTAHVNALKDRMGWS